MSNKHVRLQQFRLIKPHGDQHQWQCTQANVPIVGAGDSPHEAIIDYVMAHAEVTND